MRKLRTFVVIAAAAALAAGIAASAGAAPTRADSTLNGAGSTLIQPAFSVWGPAYASATGVEINYSGIGSGGGISAITNRTVDFGASDAPLSPDQASACNGCVQIPWALSATSVVYNVPGVGDTKLKLSGPVLANIFLGKVTSWNDASIKALNPGLSLPDQKITTVHRSDGSGDTYAFTDYLSKVSSTWRNQVGVNTAVNWPGGVGGNKNAGVSAVIGSTPGSIGYVSDAYALQNHLAKARLRNAFGKYTLPGITGIEAAAQTVKSVPADNKMSIVDPPATKKFAAAWPISTFTYIIVPTTSKNATDLRHFIFWALSPKQQASIKKLIFAPIPKVVLVAAEKTLTKIHS
ncbi:MAG TPA: phosphate ABC transporter substrate-binding protein PstS [Gaiellaceae bacterium]|nr:phosphate ABC transporter substrate-binding protein PstS [Gaiellaceae bacterium]